MKFVQLRVLALGLSLIGSLAFAGNNARLVDHPGQIQTDSDLVVAVQSHKNQFYVEAGNLVVTRILPDDTSGLPHQKWETKLSDGSTVTIVYNSDMGVRVPVQIGSSFGVGGQFIWTAQGGLVHWVHDDPKKIRPDGYVFVDGVVYGDSDNEDSVRH